MKSRPSRDDEKKQYRNVTNSGSLNGEEKETWLTSKWGGEQKRMKENFKKGKRGRISRKKGLEIKKVAQTISKLGIKINAGEEKPLGSRMGEGKFGDY